MSQARCDGPKGKKPTVVPAGLARRARVILLLASGHSGVDTAQKVGMSPRHVHKWRQRFRDRGVPGWEDQPRSGRKTKFLPDVALHLAKMAWASPDLRNRSLSPGDGMEWARQWVAEKVVDSISSQSVRRIRMDHRLKPWRHHLWLSPKVPRDAAFRDAGLHRSDLYRRDRSPNEVVWCVDEKTHLQPRTRKAKTLPPEPGIPVRVESE